MVFRSLKLNVIKKYKNLLNCCFFLSDCDRALLWTGAISFFNKVQVISLGLNLI